MSMKNLIACLLIFGSLQLTGQSPDLKKFYDAAVTAYKEKNYEVFYTNITEAGKLHPYHQGILYLRGKAAALTGKKEEAISCLSKAIQIYEPYQLEGIADFNAIKDSKEFADLLEEQKELRAPVIHSDTAFVIKDRALHSEGIEYDPEQKLFYIGSIHKRKIITINEKGETKDFCSPGFEGMTSIFGLKVDTKRKILWACASPMHEMENYDTTSRSSVFKFDLVSGRLLHKYQWKEKRQDGIFGDLILSANGDVYISDTKTNQILKVDEKRNRLEIFYSTPEFWNIQGMTFSPKEDILFISDYIKGIYRLTLKTKVLMLLTPPEKFSLKGIDGLYFYKNSLLAIQNGVTPNRATRYTLNDLLNSITKTDIIDRAHPAFGEPTLGVLSGDNFYYIANSQWGGYDDQQRIKPYDQLSDIVILKFSPDGHP